MYLLPVHLRRYYINYMAAMEKGSTNQPTEKDIKTRANELSKISKKDPPKRIIKKPEQSTDSRFRKNSLKRN